MSDDLAAALADKNFRRVVDIYSKAAAEKQREGDMNAACFLLTQAWIYALDGDDPRAADLRAKLIAHGRENEE